MHLLEAQALQCAVLLNMRPSVARLSWLLWRHYPYRPQSRAFGCQPKLVLLLCKHGFIRGLDEAGSVPVPPPANATPSQALARSKGCTTSNEKDREDFCVLLERCPVMIRFPRLIIVKSQILGRRAPPPTSQMISVRTRCSCTSTISAARCNTSFPWITL